MLFKDTHIAQGYARTRRWYVILSVTMFLFHLAGVEPSESLGNIRLLAFDLGDAQRPILVYWAMWAALIGLTYTYWTFFNDRNQEGHDRYIEENILIRYLWAHVSERHARDIKKKIAENPVIPWSPQVRVGGTGDRREYDLFLFDNDEVEASVLVASSTLPPDEVRKLRERAIQVSQVRLPFTWELMFPFVMFELAVIMAVIDVIVLRR